MSDLAHFQLPIPTFYPLRNGRVPALVDHTNNDYIVWESGAILLYVAERFDPTRKFVGVTLEERAEVWQWLIYQVRLTNAGVVSIELTVYVP